VLHPQARRAIEAAAGDLPVFDPAFSIEASRAESRRLAAAEPRTAVEDVHDADADGVPVRVYRPAGARSGVVVHLHGGGFVFHDVDVHDGLARRLADAAGHTVVSVDYRRPPEHPFPAAPDDVSTVLGWLAAGQPGLEGPVAVHGDSAGGNLALVAALRHPGTLAAVVLLYPFLDPSAGFASYTLVPDGFDPREAAWYWQQYAATDEDLTHPDLAPLLSDRLHTLPPTLVATAEHDPLRDEGEHLATLLAEAGVEVTATRYLGQVHGFYRHPAVFDAAEPMLLQAAAYLRHHLGPASG
jgi:acetyl esterase